MSERANDAVGPLVLVVDDDQDSRELYAMVLTLANFRVASAATAEQAMRLASAEPPAATVTDLRLAGSGGLELLGRLRNMPATCNIPVVVVTGDGSDERRRDAHAAGASAYLLKPCDPDDLVAEIQRLLAKGDGAGPS
jgi:CheY-like chemotaxis protein